MDSSTHGESAATSRSALNAAGAGGRFLLVAVLSFTVVFVAVILVRPQLSRTDATQPILAIAALDRTVDLSAYDGATAIQATRRGNDLLRMPVHPFQFELLEMPALSRDSVFRMAIADSGWICDSVTNAISFADGIAVWRVACGAASAFAIEVDSSG
jgi:hypothetical protein